MTARRTIIAGVAVAVIIAIGYFLATPFSLLSYYLIFEEIFPSRISWDGKTAWKRCDSAIAGKTSWPDSPQAACAAMHLCANEATLSEEQVEALTQAIRDTPGCQAP